MANYKAIVRHYPEAREFIRMRRWVHRGEAIAYGPNIEGEFLSTDGLGYRHSIFGGERLSVADVVQRERYGLVLGPSNVYGFGLAGNENTMPSLLAEEFGFPFANVGLPEGNSRNLFSILLNLMQRAPRLPQVVLHVSGGDFTSFCYTGMADPVFGSPNLKQMGAALKERGGKVDPAKQIRPLLAFSTLWIKAITDLCQLRKVPVVLADDTTFFEKTSPSEVEKDCALGDAQSPAQVRQFEIHQRYVADYHATRKKLAEQCGVSLAGPGITNDIGFVDEFHYNAAGTKSLCADFAPAIEKELKQRG